MFNIPEPHADWIIKDGRCTKKREIWISQNIERSLKYLRMTSTPWETISLTDDLSFNPFDQLREKAGTSTRAFKLVYNKQLIQDVSECFWTFPEKALSHKKATIQEAKWIIGKDRTIRLIINVKSLITLIVWSGN